MSKRPPRQRSVWLLMQLAVFLTACGQHDVVVVRGQQYDYHIPKRYDNGSSGWTIFGNIKGLEGLDSPDQEALLRIPRRELFIPALASDEGGASMLLSWDKDYSQVRQDEKWFLRNARYQGEVAGYRHFRKVLGGTVYDYYYNFDPLLPPRRRSPGEYAVHLDKIDPDAISGCSVHTVYDGISVEFSLVSNEFCRVENWQIFYRSLERLMESWRVEKPRSGEG